MARPDTVLCAIKEAIKSSGRLPDETSYATFELDQEGGQANVYPPIVEITNIGTIRSNPHNTNFVEYATDDSGNQIGYIFDTLFDMEFQIDIWTREGDGYHPEKMGESVRTALYRYDNYHLGETLPDPDGTGNLTDASHFYVEDGEVADDLTMTPALRRWRQTGTVWFKETLNTAEEYGESDYVTSVEVPEDGNFEAGSATVELVYDATPSTDSEADNYT